MKLINNILFLETIECVKADISDRTVEKWKSPLRIANPDDKRCKLINYELMKDKYKDLVIDQFGNPYQYYWNSRIVEHIQFNNDLFIQLRAFRLEDGTGLPPQHLTDYTKCCNVLRFLDKISPKTAKKIGFDSVATVYDAVGVYIEKEEISLPTSYSKLKKKLRDFKSLGIKVIISKKFGNSNTLKITGSVADWILATYALPTKPDTAKVHTLYSQRVQKNNWPTLTEAGIYAHLNKTDIRPLWYLSRHGEKAFKNEYGHTMKLFLPTYRDAMWAVDGTKLNFYYYDENSSIKMAASLKMVIVTDVFSDAIIGLSVDYTEDHVSTYHALKDAARFSGQRPYQIIYDGQGGFKKAEMQGLMTQLSKIHFPAKPYTPQAKPVESVIGRFQKQVMRDHWFFTGQNITSKAQDSRANMDFILSNKDELPTEEQIRELMPQLQKQWNESIQRKHKAAGQSRVERYLTSIAPEPREITPLDMVDCFWLERKKPVTYYAKGIELEIAKQKHIFEVYEADGTSINSEFLAKYTKAKFTVKYDPEDLSHIRLYDVTDGRFIAVAEIANRYARFVGDLTEDMRAEIDENMQFRKDQMDRAKKAVKKAAKNSGMDAQMLVEVGYKSNMKEAMNAAEAAMELTEAIDSMNEQEVRAEALNRL